MTPSAEERLEDLIVRLEKASDGSRELDCLIRSILTPIYSGWTYGGSSSGISVWNSPDGTEHEECFVSNYTTSLDAALTLVPDGFMWLCRDGIPGGDAIGRSEPYANVRRTSTSHNNGYGATPALALVIACLKARAHRSKS